MPFELLVSKTVSREFPFFDTFVIKTEKPLASSRYSRTHATPHELTLLTLLNLLTNSNYSTYSWTPTYATNLLNLLNLLYVCVCVCVCV